MSAPFIIVEEDGEVKGILFLKRKHFPPKLQLEIKRFRDNVNFKVFSGEGREIPFLNDIAELPLTFQVEKPFKAESFTFKKRLLPKKKRQVETITLLSTWNEQCGIATYSHFLVEALTQLGRKVHVARYIWDAKIPSVIHSQIEFGIFPKADMVAGSNPAQRNYPKIATWHTVFKDPGKTGFGNKRLINYITAVDREYDAHIVHTSLAKKWLMKAVSKPVYIIPHGSLLWNHIGKKEARLKLDIPLDAQLIFAFGFSTDSKGFSEIAEIIPKLRDTYPRLILIVSGAVHGIAKEETGKTLEKVKLLEGEGVKVLGRFLSEEEVNLYAEASDILVFNYYDPDYVTSASGAIHRVLNAGAPIICSDSNRTIDFQDGVHCLKYPMGDTESLQACIETLLTEHDLAEELGKNAELLAEATSWKRVAQQHIQVYESVTKGVELFGPDYYNEEYFVGKKGGLSYLTPNGKIKQWSYYNPQGEWLGCKPIVEAWKKLLNPKNMLDVGAGRGTFIAYARDVGIEAEGFDFSFWAVNEGRYPRCKPEWLKVYDATKTPWPYPDNSFDLVTVLDFCEHIYEEDIDKVIREIQRVSRKWIFYNIGSTMHEDDEYFVLKKGETPPIQWQSTAVAGHVNVRPCIGYWKKKLINKEWILRDDLVEKFRQLVPKKVLQNWICIIITSRVE